jgi:hypothetical protein
MFILLLLRGFLSQRHLLLLLLLPVLKLLQAVAESSLYHQPPAVSFLSMTFRRIMTNHHPTIALHIPVFGRMVFLPFRWSQMVAEALYLNDTRGNHIEKFGHKCRSCKHSPPRIHCKHVPVYRMSRPANTFSRFVSTTTKA